MASIGLPGLNGFVSEFLTILGAFTSTNLGIAYGSFAALGIILGAVYMLHMAAHVIWGPLKTPGHEDDDHGSGHGSDHGAVAHGEPAAAAALPTDIGGREIAILVPLALAVIILGVKPNIVLQTIEQPAQALLRAATPAPMMTTSHKPPAVKPARQPRTAKPR